MLECGEITTQDFAWTAGLPDWQPLSSLLSAEEKPARPSSPLPAQVLAGTADRLSPGGDGNHKTLSKPFILLSLALATGICVLGGGVLLYKTRSDTAVAEKKRDDAAQNERFRSELNELLVEAEQVNLRAKEIFTNRVLQNRAHDEGDLDEAVKYEREVNRVRPLFESQFLTLKTRFEHMTFPPSVKGRAEFANAVSSWERLVNRYSGEAAIDAEMHFVEAKRQFEFYFRFH